MFTRAPFSLSSSLKQFAVCLFGISSPRLSGVSGSFSRRQLLLPSEALCESLPSSERWQASSLSVHSGWSLQKLWNCCAAVSRKCQDGPTPPKHNNFGMLHVNATQTSTISEGNFWYFKYFVWKPVEANLQKIVRDPDCSSIRGQHLSCLQTVGIDATSCV